MKVKQTPNKDGYIFHKTFEESGELFRYEMWDFLNPLEARQCLGLAIQENQKARYDAFGKNKDAITTSDIVLLVFDVSEQSQFNHCVDLAKKIRANKATCRIVFVANKCDKGIPADLVPEREQVMA